MARYSWVYVIAFAKGDGNPCSPFKVGRSDDPDKRLEQLQAANPHELVLAFAVEVQHEIADDIEAEIHAHLKEHEDFSWIRNEWFEGPIKTAAIIIAYRCVTGRLHRTVGSLLDVEGSALTDYSLFKLMLQANRIGGNSELIKAARRDLQVMMMMELSMELSAGDMEAIAEQRAKMGP